MATHYKHEFWLPPEKWRGEDCYVVGGGPSLRHCFDWSVLEGKNVIGCNCAFLRGDVVDSIVFGDVVWWEKIGREATKDYGGAIVDSTRTGVPDKDVHHMGRLRYGLAVGTGKEAGHLAWNGNTGSAAINLGLLYGAKNIYLLGFDMKLGDEGKANWHDLRHEKGEAKVYPRFIRDLAHLNGALGKFPGASVVNLTDDSNLPYFPKVSPAEHFGSTVLA